MKEVLKGIFLKFQDGQNRQLQTSSDSDLERKIKEYRDQYREIKKYFCQ